MQYPRNLWNYKVVTILIFLCLFASVFQWDRSDFSVYAQKDTSQQAAQPDTLSWHRPRFDERRDERHAMVEQHIRGAHEVIRDERVFQAMMHVPRHLFVPRSQRRAAYQNRPLPIGHGQTISQPFIVGYMTELLELEPGEQVLEIGTGSGYQAAVLSEITPEVFTIEIIEELGRAARERFDQLGYNTIQVRLGDGYYGWETQAPFDAIIVTAAAGHIPPPLLRQLKRGGRMMIPLGGPYQVQTLVQVIKNEQGQVTTKQLMPVRFVPMTGAAREQ